MRPIHVFCNANRFNIDFERGQDAEHCTEVISPASESGTGGSGTSGGVRNMKELKIQIQQVSESTSRVTVRTHQVLVDRMREIGGSDQGPMGGELFLAAIGGCFMSNLLAAVKARKAPVSAISAEVIGTVVDSPARFSQVKILITAEAASRETLNRLLDIAERGCIMMNTLRGKLDIHISASIGATA
jgi:putative redox protein